MFCPVLLLGYRTIVRNPVNNSATRACEVGHQPYNPHDTKEWNSLPASVFPSAYNPNPFKVRVNRLLLGVVSLIDNTNSYVIVQVSKGENGSNVDALIHRVVPSGQLDKFTDALRSRKAFSNFKRFEVRQRATEEKAPEPEIKENDGIILGLDTETQNVGSINDSIDKIEKVILNLAKTTKVGGPAMMRASEDYNIRPEVVKLRGNDDKSSVMVKIDSGSIISAVKDLLSSKTVAEYADYMAQKAAVVYRALKDEMGSEQRSKNKYD